MTIVLSLRDSSSSNEDEDSVFEPSPSSRKRLRKYDSSRRQGNNFNRGTSSDSSHKDNQLRRPNDKENQEVASVSYASAARMSNSRSSKSDYNSDKPLQKNNKQKKDKGVIKGYDYYEEDNDFEKQLYRSKNYGNKNSRQEGKHKKRRSKESDNASYENLDFTDNDDGNDGNDCDELDYFQEKNKKKHIILKKSSQQQQKQQQSRQKKPKNNRSIKWKDDHNNHNHKNDWLNNSSKKIPKKKRNSSSSLPSSSSASSASSVSSKWKVPENLTSPTQLKWHQKYDEISRTYKYLPCRIIIRHNKKSSAAAGCKSNTRCNYNSDDSNSSRDGFSDDDDDDDDDDEVEVEYISSLYKQQKSSILTTKLSSTTTKPYVTVTKKRLIPYFDNCTVNSDDMDYNDISLSQWSLALYDKYRKSTQDSNRTASISPRFYNNDRYSNSSLQKYIAPKEQEPMVEYAFLNQVLNVAKERAGYKICVTTVSHGTREATKTSMINNNNNNNNCNNIDGDNKDFIEPHESDDNNNYNCDEHDNYNDDALEEPYTQAIDYKAMGYNTSDEEMEEFYNEINQRPSSASMMKSSKSSSSSLSSRNHNTQKMNREPIRPGDVIEYYCPMFIFGDERGKRFATIISVDPKDENSVLKLSSGDCLPIETKVKRIKTLIESSSSKSTNTSRSNTTLTSSSSSSSVKRRLIDHPGIYRQIQDFKLVKLNPIKGYDIQTEAKRVQKILQNNMDKFRKTVVKSGFAPMDMMNTFGKKRNDDHVKLMEGEMRKKMKLNENLDNSTRKCNRKEEEESFGDDECFSSDSDDEVKFRVASNRDKIHGLNQSSPQHLSTLSKHSSHEKRCQTKHPQVEDDSSEEDEMLRKLNKRFTISRKTLLQVRSNDMNGNDGLSDGQNEEKLKMKANQNRGKLHSPKVIHGDDDSDSFTFKVLQSAQQETNANFNSSSLKKVSSSNIKKIPSSKHKLQNHGYYDPSSLGLSSDSDDDFKSLLFSKKSMPKEKKDYDSSKSSALGSLDFNHSSSESEEELKSSYTQRGKHGNFSLLKSNKQGVMNHSHVTDTTNYHCSFRGNNNNNIKTSTDNLDKKQDPKNNMTRKEGKAAPFKSLTLRKYN